MRIYVVGDSISIHYGPYLQRYLPGMGMEYSRLDGPDGANGGDSSMVLSFLKGRAAEEGIDADILLVNCGLHDMKTDPATGAKQVPLDRYGRNLSAILETVADMKPDPVWIRTTPCDERVHNREGMSFHRFSADCAAYNRVADRIMREAGVPSIDLHTFTLCLGPDPYCDHVHFHEHVRERQAAFITGWLASFTGYGTGRAGP